MSATAFVGLGANLGSAADTIEAALTCLSALPDTELAARSSVWRTAPVDATGPDYFNAVAMLRTALDAPALLDALQGIERDFGRARPFRNAPRTLDLDLLLHGETVVGTPRLVVPHPRMHERAFVLAPLLELAPAVRIPGVGPAAACLAACAGQRIERLERAGHGERADRGELVDRGPRVQAAERTSPA